MLTRQCPCCQRQLHYGTLDAFERAYRRQSRCRVCAAKIDPRQRIEDAPAATEKPLADFWRLLDAQASASKAA